MFVTDPLVKDWVDANAAMLHWAGPAAGAVFVGDDSAPCSRAGRWRRRVAPVELAPVPAPAAAAPAAPGRRLFNRVLLPVDASDQAARAVRVRHRAAGATIPRAKAWTSTS